MALVRCAIFSFFALGHKDSFHHHLGFQRLLASLCRRFSFSCVTRSQSSSGFLFDSYPVHVSASPHCSGIFYFLDLYKNFCYSAMSYFLEFFLNFDLGFYKYTKGCLLALCQILRLLEPDHLPGAESAGDGKTSVCGCVGGASLARVVWTNIDLYTHFLDLQRVCQDILWHKVPKPDPIHPSIQ